MQLSLDSAFTQVVGEGTKTSTGGTVTMIVGSGATDINYSFFPGTTYYWRVKVSAPLTSKWSTTRSFAFESSNTFALVSPANGAYNVPVKPLYTWTESTGATSYEISLSDDPTFTILNWSHTTTNLFYQDTEDLKNNTTYYWRVRGVTGTGTSTTDASEYKTGIFTTAGVETTSAAVTIVTTEAPTPTFTVTIPPSDSPVIPTYILWVIVGVGAILVVALIVLIVRTRRVA
jgi:hypothetical protein